MKGRGQAHIAFRDVISATQAMRALHGVNIYGKDMVCLRSGIFCFCILRLDKKSKKQYSGERQPELTYPERKQKVSYAKDKSHMISKLDGTFKIPIFGGAVTGGEGAAAVPFVPLPSAPVGGAPTTTAAGAAAAAAGQKRQREEESGEFTFLPAYREIQPNIWWKQMRKRRWMLRMMMTSARVRGPGSVETQYPIYGNVSETEFTG